MSEEYGNDIITITDEEGNEYALEHLDTFEENGTYYLAFLPADLSEDDEDYGIILLKQETIDGEDMLSPLSEEEEDGIYDKFMERLFADEDE